MTRTKAIVLPDHPAHEDKFQGGGHKRAAEALAHAVEQLADKDGAIGLEGPWGSGKSTVINLASEHFSKNGNGTRTHRVFTFDLWLHNPDILKLAFLEEFIAWAHTQDLLEDHEKKDFIERVSDRKITTRLESRRQFSLSGIAFVLLIPLLPIIYTWLSPFAFSDTAKSIHLKYTSLSAHSAALFAIASLYIVFLVAFAVRRFQQKTGGWRAALSSAAKLFSQETDHDEVTQHIRERSPTNEEFQSFFREILSIVQKKNDRIVFVFDNIDRLPLKSVPKVWSECRSIFAMRSRGEQPKHSSVTAIIPYEKTYVSNAIAQDLESETSANHQEWGDHLILKTFDITVRVAPPLVTDWRKLLEERLDEAFPKPLTETQKHRIFRLFDIQNQASGTPPTPRHIISYINEIGAVWNQWGDKIDVTHIALYTLLRRKIEERPHDLKNSGFVDQMQARVFGTDDVLKSLVALHYNVEPEHAYQVLLGQDIAKAAIENEPVAFVKLSQMSGFNEVFPDVVLQRAEQWAREGAENLGTLANNIAASALDRDYLSETWQNLSEAIAHLTDADTAIPQNYAGLSLIIENVPPAQSWRLANQILIWFNRNLPEETKRNSSDGREWANFYSSIHGALRTVIGDDEAQSFQEAVQLPKGVPFAFGVCATCSGNPQLRFNTFGRTTKIEELRPKLAELVATELSILKEISHEQPWFLDDQSQNELSTKLCERLYQEDMELPIRRDIVSLLGRLRVQSQKPKTIQQTIKTRVDDGTLIWQIMRAHSDEDTNSVGTMLWLLIDANVGIETPKSPGNHPTFGDVNPIYAEYKKFLSGLQVDSEEVQQVTHRIVQAKQFSDWLEYALDTAKPDFFRTVFRHLVDDGTYDSLHVAEAIHSFPPISEFLGEDLSEKYLENLQGWSGHFSKTFAGAEALKVPPLLIAKIYQFDLSEAYKPLLQAVDDHFNRLQRDNWLDMLEGKNTAALQLLLTRIETGQFEPPLEAYQAALKVYASKLIDGKLSVSDLVESRPLLFQGIKKSTLSGVARDVLIDLKDATTTRESVEHFLQVCAPLAAKLPLTDYPDTTIDQIVTRLAGSETDQSSAYLKQHGAKLRKCFASANQETKERLIEKLESLMSADDASKQKASNLADMLAIEIIATTDE